MAKFYGTLRGEGSQADTKPSTRTGQRGIQATAQHAQGSVQVRMWESSDGTPMVQLYAQSGESTSQPGQMLGSWTLAQFIEGGWIK